MNKRWIFIISGLMLIAIFFIGNMVSQQSVDHPSVPVAAEASAKVSVASQGYSSSSVTVRMEVRKSLAVPHKLTPEQRPGAVDDRVEYKNYFLGRWCNNKIWPETGGIFALEFSLAEDGNIKAVFSNGGPFSETLRVAVSGANADLYFVAVDGSMAFNETAIKYDAEDCTERVASARVVDADTLELANFNDVCGYVSAPAETLTLVRLGDTQVCSLPDEQHQL